MAIGTSDGKSYEDELSYQMNIPHESDYDMQGFKESNQSQADNGHYPDTFKLPNHITFSDQSQYHGVDGNEGGKWAELGEGRYSFTPGATNFKHHSLQEMQDYFKKYEPGNVLNAQAGGLEPIPQIDYEEKATPEKGQNFETLYQQLRDNKNKVKPGNLLRLYDHRGYQYHYQRDDDYEHGFRLFLMPDKIS